MTMYNQGMCGSCYAIAALSSIYISININTTSPNFFSIQELLSCGKDDIGLFGCLGGYYDDTFRYVMNKGIGP